jgi:hypothetical protein
MHRANSALPSWLGCGGFGRGMGQQQQQRQQQPWQALSQLRALTRGANGAKGEEQRSAEAAQTNRRTLTHRTGARIVQTHPHPSPLPCGRACVSIARACLSRTFSLPRVRRVRPKKKGERCASAHDAHRALVFSSLCSPDDE